MKNGLRYIINIFLIIVFVAVSILIITPLIADVQYGLAEKAIAAQKLWQAEAHFKKAIEFDPADSEYLAGFGSMLLEYGLRQKGRSRIYWLERAIEYYKKAFKLNAECAEYTLSIGLAELGLGNTEDAFNYFKKALRNDPNGFNTLYSVGYAGMAIWDFLDKDKKELVLRVLRESINLRSAYSIYIYPLVWERTKDFSILQRMTPANLVSNRALYDFICANNLWQFRKRQEETLNSYRRKEEPEKFEEEQVAEMKYLESLKKPFEKNSQLTDVVLQQEWLSNMGKEGSAIKDGNMYCNGTIYSVIRLKPGRVIISIEAKKTLVLKTKDSKNPKFYPYMIIKLDDRVIGEAFVPNDEWQEYQFLIETSGGLKTLSVSFVNDIYDPSREEDRNLSIGNAKVLYQ